MRLHKEKSINFGSKFNVKAGRTLSRGNVSQNLNKMKKALIILLIGISNISFSQTITEIDSVASLVCDYLNELVTKNDTIKMHFLIEYQINPYLNKIEQSQSQEIEKRIYYRLQRNCVEFRILLDRLDPPKDELIRITKKPKPKISKKQLEEFKSQKEFYYLEWSGDTTNVIMEGGRWTDFFSDETTSKLTYNWVNKAEFELIFIESNNEIRYNFSLKGDKYIYQILSKEDGYYYMTVNIPGQNTFEKFKLYYK
ncbi:MAG: hypothetical protein M9897_01150 [Brumimicrobium sp.]|nr:hypothetical protein [Brumimicrobium sp.]